jgi:hypothetical protein
MRRFSAWWNRFKHLRRIGIASCEARNTKPSGGRPAHVIATNQTSDIVRDYLKAYKNAVEYVHQHAEVWDEYAASIMMENHTERKLLRENGANLVDRDAPQIAFRTTT